MNSSTFGLGLNFRLTNLTELLNGKNHKQVVDSFLELLSQIIAVDVSLGEGSVGNFPVVKLYRSKQDITFTWSLQEQDPATELS